MKGTNLVAKARPVVAVGAFSIECNSFAPGSTTLEQIENQDFAVGDDISRNSAGTESEFAGAMDFFSTKEVTLLPTLVAHADAGPPITIAAFRRICAQLLGRLPAQVDGVYLMLHGSAFSREENDPEGALLAAIRERIGVTPPISVSLDLHANFTEKMLKATDIAVAYRTCPHIDLYETGAQAASLLFDAVIGKIKPTLHMKRIPMVTPPEKHDNNFLPYGSLMNLCKQIESEGAYAASLLTVQPWLNVPDLGWKAIVVAEKGEFDGSGAAERIASAAWSNRHEFMKLSGLPLKVALEEAVRHRGLAVFADLGDATNGGSYGDSTELLRQILQSQLASKNILSITDAEVSTKIHSTNKSSMTVDIGSGKNGEYNEKVRCKIEIVAKTNKNLVYSHPAAKGSIGHPGKSALIKVLDQIGDTFVVIHDNPVRVIDPSIYQLFDIDLQDFGVIQAKSHVSFKPGFAPFTEKFVLADTLGPTTANLLTLNFDQRTIPTFPFDGI